ncbi:hypothetical protein MNBD_NITROSPIRAE01-2034 [hydrothermal vent metagenome]|uniref:Uncharacterized protein n=1 Tax=hydrothermal vent metagenome TaxID=652676 RepID=A0A3B1DXK0_9ZZZZ
MATKNFTLFSLLLAVFFLFSSQVKAQSTVTLTTTSTVNSLSNDPILGCTTCAAVNSATDPFPDTSRPIFRGDPEQALLPQAIADGLPPDNQFGVGVPAGSSNFPLSISSPFSATFSDGVSITSSNTFSSTPAAGGGNNNTITQSINQFTPGGTLVTGVDQDFAILFTITSLTDPDGNLVGTATGTFTQTINGVTVNGTTAFDNTNGFSGTNIDNGFTSDGSFFTPN